MLNVVSVRLVFDCNLSECLEVQNFTYHTRQRCTIFDLDDNGISVISYRYPVYRTHSVSKVAQSVICGFGSFKSEKEATGWKIKTQIHMSVIFSLCK